MKAASTALLDPRTGWLAPGRGGQPASVHVYYFTAPSDRPWTSLSCAANPAISTGSETMTAAASLAAKNPSPVMKLLK